jgi:hypothetical protein
MKRRVHHADSAGRRPRGPAPRSRKGAREHRRLMQRGVVINLRDQEIRDVGARDEPASPVAWIDQRGRRLSSAHRSRSRGARSPSQVCSYARSIPARPCLHRRATTNNRCAPRRTSPRRRQKWHRTPRRALPPATGSMRGFFEASGFTPRKLSMRARRGGSPPPRIPRPVAQIDDCRSADAPLADTLS